MSQPAHRYRHTFADYLALEEVSNVKHEYLGGEIYAMAGETHRRTTRPWPWRWGLR